ncbi:hypothetical protein HNR43_002403 [Anoxybacillus mongoliensis]|uniref:Uncharacterized protein n=1 Tax=Anoxybacillus mongoliensis TaxID=452565 RepID=A0A7W8JG13_9BACL|nr:hypothetical protein [Anoxybacillus mongoliensis]
MLQRKQMKEPLCFIAALCYEGMLPFLLIISTFAFSSTLILWLLYLLRIRIETTFIIIKIRLES